MQMVSGVPHEVLLRAGEAGQGVDRSILPRRLGELRKIPDGGKGRSTFRLHAAQWRDKKRTGERVKKNMYSGEAQIVYKKRSALRY
jgi:hypothetical protein